jgi:hypothetical protein
LCEIHTENYFFKKLLSIEFPLNKSLAFAVHLVPPIPICELAHFIHFEHKVKSIETRLKGINILLDSNSNIFEE